MVRPRSETPSRRPVVDPAVIAKAADRAERRSKAPPESRRVEPEPTKAPLPRSREEIAATIRAALEELEENGRLSPEDVIDSAKDRTSPLHEHFEWDDSSAAHAWRLVQARALIRHVKISVTVDDDTIHQVVYVKNPELARESGYVRMTLVTNKDDRKEVLQAEFEAILGRLERVRAIAQAFDLEDVLKALILQTQTVAQKLLKAA